MITIAHRGAMKRGLQNTAEGIRFALARGVDCVEIDVADRRADGFRCVHGMGTGVPLAECLAALDERSGLIIHLKGRFDVAGLRHLVSEAGKAVEPDRLVFAAHRSGVLKRLRSVAPRIRLGRFGLIPALFSLWKRPVWDIALINQIVLWRGLVEALQKRGIPVYASCVEELRSRASVLQLGVDGAFVNLR